MARKQSAATCATFADYGFHRQRDWVPHFTRIDTGVEDAQRWWSIGLLWCWGFHHEEALHCFARCIEADPTCAMGHWGIAFALAPNYNKPWVVYGWDELRRDLPRCRDALLRGVALARRPHEVTLLHALLGRVPPPALVRACVRVNGDNDDDNDDDDDDDNDDTASASHVHVTPEDAAAAMGSAEDPDALLALYADGAYYEEGSRNTCSMCPACLAVVDRACGDAFVARMQVVHARLWGADAGQQRGAPAARGSAAVHEGDVAALYADALITRNAWKLWDLTTGVPAQGAHTLLAKRVLEQAMARLGMQHPGLLHLYIHLMEMSPEPETALPVADALRVLVPDAGHLAHMPSHIDVLCGHYDAARVANDVAIRADEAWGFTTAHLVVNPIYTAYRCHDYHFKVYASMFSGQFNAALEAADAIQSLLSTGILLHEDPPMVLWLEAFNSIRLHVLVRFGAWERILSECVVPQDTQLYAMTTAITHYAHAIAHAVLGDVPRAKASAQLFREAQQRMPPNRNLFNNTCEAILTVARPMMEGELLYREGKYEQAYAMLRRAVEVDDALAYDEPWGWMNPVRHALGALLLEQGHVEEAEAVYRADLGCEVGVTGATVSRARQHPNNVWALHGLHECLRRRGVPEGDEELCRIAHSLKAAQQAADVEVNASCLCRLHRFDDVATCCDTKE